MTCTSRPRHLSRTGAALALALSLAACGGNVGGGSDAAAGGEDFPGGDPISLYVGQDPGGSTDLIARALAEEVSDDLGVPVTVENKPGANGALAAQELAGEEADGHTLMVYNGSLAYITPLAVAEGEAPDIADYDVVTGVSLDDYVLVTAPDSTPVSPPSTTSPTPVARSSSAPPASAPAVSSRRNCCSRRPTSTPPPSRSTVAHRR
jgi:tripartite-type tricarboxylate transporter receptor subunit TctC